MMVAMFMLMKLGDADDVGSDEEDDDTLFMLHRFDKKDPLN